MASGSYWVSAVASDRVPSASSSFVTRSPRAAPCGCLSGGSSPDCATFLGWSLAWALISGLEYYWFGHVLLGASTWVQVVMVCAGLVWLVISLSVLRQRALRQLQTTAATADPL